MIVKSLQSNKEQMPSSHVQLSSLAGYQRFGDYLRLKRKQFGLLQREMAEYCSLTPGAYGYLERERRAPQMDELVPMFTALIQLQSDKHLSPMQVIEAETFFRLGKAIIENKQKKRPNVSQQEWDGIERQLINLVDHRQHNSLHLVSGENGAFSNLVLEPPGSRRRKALRDVQKTDLSHLLEREAWVKRVLAYPDRVPPIKVSVTQAGMGAGKSHAFALLIQRLIERDDLFLVPYQFKHSETMTSDDHLDEFLATLHADLTMRVADETKQRPLAERIEQSLNAIRAHDQKVIILLDDAQEMFPWADKWSTSWHQFFEAFITEPHRATLYMMTRVWPNWDERKRSFLEEDNLPDLSIEAGIQLWKRQGFDDVDDDLLRKVCERCGQNPQAIEMLAFQYKRRGFSINWKGSFRRTNENPHTASLKKLLESDTLFSGSLDETSRQALQQVFSNRLSGEDLRLVECLALSPLGIPFDLLVDRFDYAAHSYEQLVKASFADLNIAASGRASVVPLVREAILQSITIERKQEVEELITDIYAFWLQDIQDFRDDAEKSALIAEMVVRYIRSRQLLKAAELFISFGWLCALFGHMTRIQRVFEAMVKVDRGKEEDVNHEVGRSILKHHIGLKMGQKIITAERDQIYLYIHSKVLADEVTLQAYSEIDVLHHLLIMYLRNALFNNARQVLDETLARLQKNGLLNAEIYASYLNNKAQLFARWWEKAESENNHEEVQRLKHECIATLKESIVQWRYCLKHTLPLQTHYVNFKLARTLNDYAYRHRLVGNLVEAQEAIEESLHLKKKGGALPHSLAISLSEYSQILALQGSIRKALVYNEEAIAIIERLIDEGDTSHNPEFGVFLIERADILKLQARLEDAKALFERAIPLIGEKPSRQSFRLKAKQNIEEISFTIETGQTYQLDKHWYTRYLGLASYDSLAWLTYTGPFTEDEQGQWQHLLPYRVDTEVSERMTDLIIQSRQREFSCSQEEKRTPKLWYPLIPLDEVQNLIKEFEKLKTEIEKQETNAIVRSLYIGAINEHTRTLRQCEATALGDQSTVWECNLSLYGGKPSIREVYIALQSLCEMVLEAQNHEKARGVAQDILQQLKSWGLSPLDIVAMEFFSSKQEPIPSFKQKPSDNRRNFSHTIVQQFFQDVFINEYHAEDWNVEIAPARDGTYIDVDLKTLFLPAKSFSLDKIRELLAEEIEIHAYRSMSGLRSPLALLGSGLAGYAVTEEGLANHYIQQISLQIYGDKKSKTWIGTLTTGLASGVLTPVLSFYELATFLEKTFLINKLLTSKSITWNEAVTTARQQAWSRAARTFRGVPHLEDAGCCSLKDTIYLRGYLAVRQVIEQIEEERLFVGKMGIEHLSVLDELNIVEPYYPHHHLALAPDLLDQLSHYKDS